MRGRIFISYRRDDAPADARSIRDRLARKFGASHVFMDVDNLMAGQRFDLELDKALSQCDVLVAVIGRHWMDLLSAHRRLGGRDYVREEITGALKREIVVIPVLVGREGQLPALPRSEDLPKELRTLVEFQKHGVAHETFGRDSDELAKAISAIFRVRRSSSAPWRGVAVGGFTGLGAAIISLGLLMGALFWFQSRTNTELGFPPKTIADKKSQEDWNGTRSHGETIQSVMDEGARRRFELFETAAAHGDVVSMTRLGSLYEEGTGVPKNLQLAISWYRKAADAGSDEAKAKLKKLKVSR